MRIAIVNDVPMAVEAFAAWSQACRNIRSHGSPLTVKRRFVNARRMCRTSF